MGKQPDKDVKDAAIPPTGDGALFESDVSVEAFFAEGANEIDSADGGKDASSAKHAKDLEAEFPEYMQRARRVRRTLTVVIIVLLLLITVACVLVFYLIDAANNAATQQKQVYMEERTAILQTDTEKDAATVTEKQTTVPNLIGLFGKTMDESVEYLQHGAQIAGKTNVNEEGNPVKQEVRVILSDESSDSRSGTPTVYLGLNESGLVCRAGYSVATSSLGYGSISFADAVQNEGIIENTLKEVGLDVQEGSAKLPTDKTAYSTYATDGTTLTRESYTFTGTGTASSTKASYEWSAVLKYDYTMANTTGNLAETTRTIYVYIEK